MAVFVGQQWVVVIFAIPVVIGLEVWRRSLRHRTPQWVYVISALLVMAIAGGIGYAQWSMSRAVAALSEDDASEKATNLADGISRAMNGNAIAIACALLAVIVLAIATWRARGIPEGGAIARVVNDQGPGE